MKTRHLFLHSAALAAMVLPACLSRAGQPFEVTVNSLDGTNLERSASASNFPDLISEALKADNAFAIFEKRASIAVLDYAGVKDAIIVRQNQAGTEAILRIPITGLERRFTGRDRDEVEDRIKDYFKSDGEEEYEKFIEAINRRSKISPIDGNPNAATARLAAGAYGEFGSLSPESARGNGSGVSILAEAGRYQSGEFDGDSYGIPLSATVRFSDRVSAVLSLPLTYLRVEGAESYNVGFGVSLPIRIRQATEASAASEADGKSAAAKEEATPRQPWTWQVTPTVAGVATGSVDFATGGVILQGALSNLLSYNFGRFTLAMGNHFSWLEGLPVEVDDYSVSTGVRQFIIKNGLQVIVPLGDRWMLSAYGIHTHFLEDAAVTDYFTVGGEAGYRLLANSSTYVKLGLYGEYGSGYNSGTVRLGTGWKF